ncbi:MAG: hypothetical protein ABL904_05790 [Hyphomicrobiaceae bacterium]
MPLRVALLIGVAVFVTGCANDHARTSPSLGSGTQPAMLGASTIAREHEAADLKRAAKQTVSAKLLAAIALERVTGRTPDPARFNELRR